MRVLSVTLVLALGGVAPVVASPDASVAERMAQNTPFLPVARDAPRNLALPPLAPELARFDPAMFLEERHRLTEALSALRDRLETAIRPAPTEIDLLLDLAALHLSQRMLPEARSFLNALPDAGGGTSAGSPQLAPTQVGRAAALGAALDGFGAAAGLAPAGWADAPLFDALHHVGAGNLDAARPLLPQAAVILAGYPVALSDAVLPPLLMAAIETGAWDVARDLATRLGARKDKGLSTPYRYLLGRAAALGGDMVAAFDNHALAASGTDEWAQRSRLALIDIGRTTGTLATDDARQMLQQTRALWTGGALGLATLQRIAGLELAERRDLPALDALADIIRLHPDTREAEAAVQQAHAMIAAIYERGLAGDIPLAEMVAAHRAIARDYRFDQVFPPLAEAFADLLAESGASGLAAAEYAALRAQIDAQESPADGVAIAGQDQAGDRLRLKHAAALQQGGRLSEAEELLADPVTTPDPLLQDRYNFMRAQLFAATDRPADVLTTRMVAPSDAYRRLRAEAAFELGEWDAAREAYEQLLRRLGPDMQAEDRINLLLATFRSGDPDRLRELTRSFPELGDRWTALAEGLTADAPDVLPLRDASARQRVEKADNALRLLQSAGSGDMP
ncbi:MAG: hypothetical protein NWR54_01085 [Paracoccaceae bacterium]|nr:hypothetical protein [Paracoccaceae bacterium]